MKIEIQGQDAVQATEELLSIEGLEGSYETVSEVEREGTLVTIATIVAITAGTMTIAEKLYQWGQKYQKSRQNLGGARIEKVVIINGDKRILLENASPQEIQKVLE